MSDRGADATADALAAERLRAIRKATVGDWWLHVKPVVEAGAQVGFQAQAHTMRGLPAVWAGPIRTTLGEATDDAVAIVPELRRHR